MLRQAQQGEAVFFGQVTQARAGLVRHHPPQRDHAPLLALALNNDQAKEKYGDLDIKLPYLRFAKAPK